MNNKCINIAISGLSMSVSDDLKNKIRHAIPIDYGINWSNLSEPKIDILLINEAFFETPNIQHLINKYHFKILKVSKEKYHSGKIENDVLYLPLENEISLKQWLESTFLTLFNQQTSATQASPKNHHIDLNHIHNMYKPDNGRLHVYDDRGTLAVIDTRTEQVWVEPTRLMQHTDSSFNYDLAKTSDFVKVSRKKSFQMYHWLWNIFFKSADFIQLSPQDGYFKLRYWPQPIQNKHQKDILRMSACFIQGAEINTVAEKLGIPKAIVRQFIAASIATKIIDEIPSHQSQFAQQENGMKTEEQGIIKKFFGNLRRRFGL